MPRRLSLACLLLLSALARAAVAQDSQTCVEAQVGTERAYSCVNEGLARLAQQAHGPLATTTLRADSPAPAVGTFDRAATAERMGDTFGHSVVSQRPPPPMFAMPLLPAGR